MSYSQGVVKLSPLLGQLVAQSRQLYNLTHSNDVDAGTQNELAIALCHLKKAIAIIAPIEAVGIGINIDAVN